jgi:hypothetical protein
LKGFGNTQSYFIFPQIKKDNFAIPEFPLSTDQKIKISKKNI